MSHSNAITGMHWGSALRLATKIFAAILLMTLAFSFIATAIGAETPILESSILTFFILLLEPAVEHKKGTEGLKNEQLYK